MKVAIVGAGASGITALKQCLDEGFDATVFEKEQHIGGIWAFSEKAGTGGVIYRSVITNTSKDITAFSDFPMPEHYPPYLHNFQVIEYLQMYCDHFRLNDHIQFNTCIHKIEKATDYQQSGRWVLTIGRNQSSETTRKTFDAVIVASGLYSNIHFPHFQGVENFRGQILHSRDYKDWKGFENKRIVVIGSANSAVDIAVELSYHCSQVYMSTRSGAWVFGRVSTNGLPADALLSRFMMMIPRSIVKIALRSQLNKKFNHSTYGLTPDHDIFTKSVVINDDLPARIICGAVKVKDIVSCIKESEVEFADGTVEKDIDAIIYATGYRTSISCLDSSIITRDQYDCLNLYKNVFPPNLKHPTLSLIGFNQVSGPVFPVSEIQSRYVAHILKNRISLPSQENMMNEIEATHKAHRNNIVKTEWSTIRLEFIGYMDELASIIGCRCSIFQLLFRDPRLAFKCFFGSCIPTQYRLMGPHSWDNAKQTIEDSDKRFAKAIQTRRYTPKSKNRSWLWLGFAVVGNLFIAYLIASHCMTYLSHILPDL